MCDIRNGRYQRNHLQNRFEYAALDPFEYIVAIECDEKFILVATVAIPMTPSENPRSFSIGA